MDRCYTRCRYGDPKAVQYENASIVLVGNKSFAWGGFPPGKCIKLGPSFMNFNDSKDHLAKTTWLS